MVKHIVMFRFLDHVPEAERRQKGQIIKEKTEALAGQLPGVQEMQVQLAPVGTSTHDLLLEGLFDTEEALDHYQSHPAHVAIGAIIKSVAAGRACFDYEV